MKKEEKEELIEVKPVAWSGEKVMKYQAIGTWGGKRIIGNPMPTKEQALDSLSSEITDWYVAASRLNEYYSSEYIMKQPRRKNKNG